MQQSKIIGGVVRLTAAATKVDRARVMYNRWRIRAYLLTAGMPGDRQQLPNR